MNILLSGANGYIGSRLLLVLLQEGHRITALVRSRKSSILIDHPNLSIIQADLLQPEALEKMSQDIDIAYYLVHGMSDSKDNFPAIEDKAIRNFIACLKSRNVKQIIYLSGLISDKNLSKHLASRLHTEQVIKESGIPYTILRAGTIIGSGSASFEIIRDLVEKLPIMVAPKWVNNLCQPIAIQDVLRYLTQIKGDLRCYNQVFDIGGPDRLSYKEMLLGYAKVRKLKRYIFVVPVLTPRLSSYWLYFVTSVNYLLASSLVSSLKSNAVCTDDRIKQIFPDPCLRYLPSIEKALELIEQQPSWKDTFLPSSLENDLSQLCEVPSHGCLTDKQVVHSNQNSAYVLERIWAIGGDNGWYCMDWAWSIRGFIDKIVGGTGLNRGRTHPTELTVGSSLDFWRVLVADKKKGHLLLYAEMKVPGEAWLEFKVNSKPNGCELIQTASFRPKGILGRLYWYLLFPIHKLIFRSMAKAITAKK